MAANDPSGQAAQPGSSASTATAADGGADGEPVQHAGEHPVASLLRRTKTSCGGALRRTPHPRVRDAFDQFLEAHRVGDGFELPVSVKLAAAYRNISSVPS